MSEALKQDPEHAAHRRLPAEAARLEKHVAHFKSVGDQREADDYAQRLKHTQDRHGHALKAAELVDKLGLSHEVKPDQITYNDALNFVAKTLHEIQHGVTTSNYTRANHSGVNDGAHIDLDKHNAPRDAAAEVVEHLGLTDQAHVALVTSFFGKAQ